MHTLEIADNIFVSLCPGNKLPVAIMIEVIQRVNRGDVKQALNRAGNFADDQ